MAYSELKLYSFEYPDVALIAAAFDLSTNPLSRDRARYLEANCFIPYGIFGSRLQEFNFPSV